MDNVKQNIKGEFQRVKGEVKKQTGRPGGSFDKLKGNINDTSADLKEDIEHRTR